jgi:short-subunit dehydrogenase
MAGEAVSSDWRGKRYWLVGASEGLGRALALTMSRSGVELILSARSANRLDELKEMLPGRSHVVPMDVTSRREVAEAAEELGEIDGIVYLAGTGTPVKATAWDAAAVETMIEVNLLGAARVLGVAVPRMLARGQGHVLLVSSLSAYRGLPGALGYGASKAGLLSLAQTMHADLQGTGVKVQVVNPGFIRTRMADGYSGKMPGIIEPETAAQEIWEHMGTDRFAKSFPLGPSAAMRFASMLPIWAYERLFR